ncbi:small integral membrane protein 11A [Gracilinanus agilis]|uniref:small integral membrane protein 11A n=1 Tax=Gracilinanus agilis TaxID=191870 RepID=UPI001CFC9CC6|nr:small integral membrane protein 11A [Gracilinanus agilis]XP_044522800.1 small integral membrane protein 11A [Gracilinanus agilis]XP_044522801.1 small integral membrane protein 11A [Gracilinanus agilis]XP_044522802.1 small integral membrane protein 11A [Gracilinanus agilis]XP_044522803.1 small integral membrane protein 11A [Gracilinanus agilis]XP_044522804.1 small integral membrane protein 11A [Gracilinanus agilis]
MWEPSWKALESLPLLLYILIAKSIILCLAFAGGKMWQRKRLEAQRKQKLEAMKKKTIEKDE